MGKGKWILGRSPLRQRKSINLNILIYENAIFVNNSQGIVTKYYECLYV